VSLNAKLAQVIEPLMKITIITAFGQSKDQFIDPAACLHDCLINRSCYRSWQTKYPLSKSFESIRWI